ncbi:MAG TPA: hypothetical protein VI564_01510 [Candidatus Nanoarchaeia archaeon]|nr:hypothetical protein [Candidatus Nanoarchaeia archaeon]
MTFPSRYLDGIHSIETEVGTYEVSVLTSRPNCNNYCGFGGSIIVGISGSEDHFGLVYLRNPSGGFKNNPIFPQNLDEIIKDAIIRMEQKKSSNPR